MSIQKRFPAIRCWIKTILEGIYNSDDNSYLTIFGKIKRVRITATVIDKKEIIDSQDLNEEDFYEDESILKSRLEFYLDDGTGMIKAVLFNISPENYSKYFKGDIVDVVGRLGQWSNSPQIYPEIIKKVDNPNQILLRKAEIIKKIKNGEIKDIKKLQEEKINNDISSSEIDLNDLFEEEEPNEVDEIKEKIYLLIEKNTLEKNGISISKLKDLLKIDEENLRDHIRDLEMESRIYQSEKNTYQSY